MGVDVGVDVVVDSPEFFACLALRHTPGLGPKTWKKILAEFGSAYDAVQRAASWHGRGLCSERVAGECVRESWRKDAEEEYRAARRLGCSVVTYHHRLYPDRLREIPDPPILLYCHGDTELLANPGLGIVGARKCTTHGLNATRTMAEDLSRAGLTVVSGMAYGIDRQAHLGGLAGIGSSIGVLGTGLDVIYPRENTDIYHRLVASGLLVAEYAPGTGPAPANFPRRNRIISGLSHAVIVAEAAKRSGSLITARLALEQGRDVYALPGHAGVPSHEGSNRLIKQGARLVDCADDILEDLRWLLTSEAAARLPGDAGRPEASTGAPDMTLGTGACARTEISCASSVPDEGGHADGVENDGVRPDGAHEGGTHDHADGIDADGTHNGDFLGPCVNDHAALEQDALRGSGAVGGSAARSVSERPKGTASRPAGQGLTDRRRGAEELPLVEGPEDSAPETPAGDALAVVENVATNTHAGGLSGGSRGVRSAHGGENPLTCSPSADRKRQIQALSGHEGRVASLLARAGSLHVDQLSRELELGAGEVSRTLVLLEIKGLVRQLPGMYYALA